MKSEPYPEVELTCPVHQAMRMRWEGRTLRCAHVEYGMGVDAFGAKIVERNRCMVSYPLSYFVTDSDAGVRMDTGTKWWELEFEGFAAVWLNEGLIRFPWGNPPVDWKLRVSKKPTVTINRLGEELHVRVVEDEPGETQMIRALMGERRDATTDRPKEAA